MKTGSNFLIYFANPHFVLANCINICCFTLSIILFLQQILNF
jgi:hypothetical protein